MRAFVFAIVTLSAATAHAQRVALATEDDQQRTALAVALDGRVEITAVAPPTGALRLDRAADAQRAAIAVGASAAVWIDEVEVCVVSADGAAFRHAPLPGSDSPRVFAAIATSLLDELLAPPETPVHVDVHVALGEPAAFAPQPTPPPPPAATIAAVAPPPPKPRQYVELGPSLWTTGSYGGPGVEAAFTVPLSERTRFGAVGMYLGGDFQIAGLGVELRRQLHRPFSVGVVVVGARMFQTMNAGLLLSGVRLSMRWPILSHGISLSVIPGFVWFPAGPPGGPLGGDAAPVVMTSLRWEIPS